MSTVGIMVGCVRSFCGLVPSLPLIGAFVTINTNRRGVFFNDKTYYYNKLEKWKNGKMLSSLLLSRDSDRKKCHGIWCKPGREKGIEISLSVQFLGHR